MAYGWPMCRSSNVRLQDATDGCPSGTTVIFTYHRVIELDAWTSAEKRYRISGLFPIDLQLGSWQRSWLSSVGMADSLNDSFWDGEELPQSHETDDLNTR